MKNKVKVLIIIIVLLLVVLGIYLFSNKEKTYENVRIIGELFDGGEVSKIIYNNKDYVISEDDNIYSIKSYNGKLYYYRSIGLNNYFIYEEELDNKTGFFYQFGQLVLNEKDSTYSMETIKQVSYEEYNTGNKDKIEYCIENIEGKYGFEINRVTIIEVEDDITIEKVWEDEEDYKFKLVYTKKDENNNVKWKYNTECAIEGQYDVIGTLGFTDDRIYINENGTIVALNKKNGEIIWKSDACKETEGAFDSVYLDKNQNLYIYRGGVTVIDKDGEKRAEISVPSTDGVEFDYIGDEELLISGVFGYAIINSSNYSVEESLSLNSFDKEEHIVLEKKDGNDKVIWKYELKDITEYDCLISSDWKYYIENKIILLHELGIITALDLETGKVVWKNSDFEGLYFLNAIFDSKNNIYSSINEGPDLCIIDKNGKTIKTIEHFDVEDKISSDETRTMYVVKFRNNEKELVMEYKNVSGEYMIVNLEDYSITYESIEE